MVRHLIVERLVVAMANNMPKTLQCWMHSLVHKQDNFMNGNLPPHVECDCGAIWFLGDEPDDWTPPPPMQ